MDKKKLIAGLNADMNRELEAVMRYLLEASIMTGFGGHEAREVFEAEVTDELGHAKLLADKIVALGGKPVISPAYPTPITDAKKALQRELKMEREAVKHYMERVKEAEEAGEVGLKVKLEELIADETGHAEEIKRLLG